MIRTIRSHIPLIVLHTILLFVFLTNIKSGNAFIGWDSVNPELNFPLNFQRALTSGWQEYYGVGLLGGHGFSALLPHTVLMYLISLFVPQWAIRTIFTYLALYFGAIGCYVLIQYIFKILQESKHTLIKINSTWFALVGSLYYLFNLATVQQIYTQTEAFTFHFVALPWLFLGVLLILRVPSPRRIFLFVAINLLASGQGFVPPIFVSYICALSVFLFTYAFYMRAHRGTMSRVFLIIAITFITNAYWLGPFSYYTLTGKQNEFLQSQNNRMQTIEFVEKSRKFGDMKDVAMLKGFFWEGTNGVERIMQPWINHYQSPLITTLGYSFFILGLCGLFFAVFKSKNALLKAFGFVYAFFFINIAIETPPFSYIVGFIRMNSPLFEQVFRNSFTKFSLGLGFAYSVYIALGVWVLMNLFRKLLHGAYVARVVIGIVVLGMIIYGIPAMQGNMLYQKLQLRVPQQYTDVIRYFKSQPDGRIADFPQDCAEGWYTYNWGYSGSGFLWYGIKQPFLSRTFDVWSKHNEQYYWEVTQALRQQDVEKLTSVLRKYDVRWILYDPNIMHCRDQKVSLKQENFIDMMSKSGAYKLTKTFASKEWFPILLYTTQPIQQSNFVSVAEKPKNINSPLWTDFDQGYIDNGTYITDVNTPYDLEYPFQGLFSKRGEVNPGISIENESDTIRLTSVNLDKLQSSLLLNFDSPYITENVVYAEIYLKPSEKDRNITEVVLEIKPPIIRFGNEVVFNPQKTITLGEILNTKQINDIDILVNTYSPRKLDNKFQIVFGTKIDNSILVLEKGHNETILVEYKTGILSDTYGEKRLHIVLNRQNDRELSIESYKISQLGYGLNSALNRILPTSCSYLDEYEIKYELSSGNNGYVRMMDQNSRSCLQFKLDSLSTEFGYIASISSKHIAGLYPKVEIINTEQGTILNPYIYNLASESSSKSFFIPPGAPYGLGYTITIVNNSLSNTLSVNEIGNFEMAYIPFEFAKRFQISQNQKKEPVVTSSQVRLNVIHPEVYLYNVTMHNVTKEDVMVLHQGFESGWLAYDLTQATLPQKIAPILFANNLRLVNHVLVNNWANGWKLSEMLNSNLNMSNNYQDTEPKVRVIEVIFWPQYLQYAGFVVLFLTIFWLAVKSYKQRV